MLRESVGSVGNVCPHQHDGSTGVSISRRRSGVGSNFVFLTVVELDVNKR